LACARSDAPDKEPIEMYHHIHDLAEDRRQRLMAEAEHFRLLAQLRHTGRHRRRTSAASLLAAAWTTSRRAAGAMWAAMRELTVPELNDPALPRVRDYPLRSIQGDRATSRPDAQTADRIREASTDRRAA
jgi:hypothetical protein